MSNNSSASEEPGYEKTNTTVRPRQNQLLDEMATERYSSRSEALRASIEAHYQRLESDMVQPLEQLSATTEGITETLDEVLERIEEVQSSRPAPQSFSSGHRGEYRPDVASAVDVGSDHAEVDDRVYGAVSSEGIATEETIAEESGISQRRTRESLQRLIERGLVSTLADEDRTLFRPAPE